MNFEKKLVILTGKTGRGTALLERNGMGLFVTLNTFALPDLTVGEYALGVKTDKEVYRREVGSLGRIKSRFSLPMEECTAAHLVVFRTYDEEVVLYGTSGAGRMWEGNLMDGFRRKRLDKKTALTDAHAASAEEFTYSRRKIEDFFFDIDPSGEYRDGALAEVNYFEYSPERKTQTQLRIESERQPTNEQRPHLESLASASAAYYDAPTLPSELERMYLSKRFGYPPKTAVRQEDSVRENDGDMQAATVAATTTVAKAEHADEPTLRIKNASAYTVEQAVAAVKTGAGFYASVKPHLDKLFAEGERFSPLEDALPGTRWVKVGYDNSGRYYVVGLIGSSPDYIAYGVPGKYGEVPDALDGADFVPLSATDSSGDGFWVLFQSAETGKEILKKS